MALGTRMASSSYESPGNEVDLEALLYMTMTAAYSKSARARSQNQGRNFGITAGGGGV